MNLFSADIMWDNLSTKKNELIMKSTTFIYTMCFLLKIFCKVQQEKICNMIFINFEHHSCKAIGKFVPTSEETITLKFHL